jgi:flagellar motility protein MotE (MotC chaperone)
MYQCSVCQKKYTTLKKAEACENSHEETRIKQEQELKDQTKLHDQLVDIRETSESYKELNARASKALKDWYGQDFVFEILSNGYGGMYTNAKCTYMVKTPIKKNDYFAGWDTNNKRVDGERILMTLGFKTGSGSGDGAVMRWQMSSYSSVPEYPAMQRAVDARNQTVDLVNQKVKEIALQVAKEMFSDTVVIEKQQEIDDLQERISELVTKQQEIATILYNYKNNVYVKRYNTECDEWINAVPAKINYGSERTVVRSTEIWSETTGD